MKIKTRWKGSATIEMAYIMPMAFVIFMGIVITAFYFHDKNILTGAAYETASVGSEANHRGDDITEYELIKYFKERVNGKLILLNKPNIKVHMGEEVSISVSAVKGRLKAGVQACAASTEPESFIRDKKKIQNTAAPGRIK